MKNYARVILGKGNVYAQECFAGNYIGADFGIEQDLTGKLPEEWRTFNKDFIPIYQQKFPGKSKISAGLACGALFSIAKWLQQGDVVLCPDGNGVYRVGEISGDYYYAAGQNLPHRRNVTWLHTTIAKSAMSEALQNSAGSIATFCSLSNHSKEIDKFLSEGATQQEIIVADPVVEDPVAFAMEKHLEEFLVKNWDQTELSQEFVIFQDENELVGQQYATDAGCIDILAVSKDSKRLLVVELKRGRASDVVVGQTLRYMGYVIEQIAEPNQTVEGVIIALEDDKKLRWALVAVPSITFYRYQVNFKLIKGSTLAT